MSEWEKGGVKIRGIVTNEVTKFQGSAQRRGRRRSWSYWVSKKLLSPRSRPEDTGSEDWKGLGKGVLRCSVFSPSFDKYENQSRAVLVLGVSTTVNT